MTDCIRKVAIIRGNITWHFFPLRAWAYKQISAWQPLLPSVKGLSFTLMNLLLCKESKFSFYSFLFFSFGKHHVVRKDLGTYVQLNMGSMSYYCWHHPWVEYFGRQTNKPLYFYVSDWNVLLMCMRWVLAIIEDYMMVEYVELLLKLCWKLNCNCLVTKSIGYWVSREFIVWTLTCELVATITWEVL